jgi:hypothetical protein
MTRTQAIEALAALRQFLVLTSGVSTAPMAARFGIDTVLGAYHYGEAPTNYGMVHKTAFKRIPRTAAVMELEASGPKRKELRGQIVLEHRVPMKHLTDLVMAGKFEEAIDSHSVCFVTKAEDAALRNCGATGPDRYHAAGIAPASYLRSTHV